MIVRGKFSNSLTCWVDLDSTQSDLKLGRVIGQIQPNPNPDPLIFGEPIFKPLGLKTFKPALEPMGSGVLNKS